MPRHIVHLRIAGILGLAFSRNESIGMDYEQGISFLLSSRPLK